MYYIIHILSETSVKIGVDIRINIVILATMKQKHQHSDLCPQCQQPWSNCSCHPQWLARIGGKLHRAYLLLMQQSIELETSASVHVSD